ncbi:excalibur calcium-binding domain-containing protein [Sphingomonas sp. PB4P5]|uniref:excalibur calcium-binding domain-containing protein n=1 Tax=Parasphingomonas puruogangriensis TaxID=3096155 RepID=UPI002FC96131
MAGLLAINTTSNSFATPGGLNAQGCHKNRKGGTGYHCHRGSSFSGNGITKRSLNPSSGSGNGKAFTNCSAARSAGAAPVRAGDAGYSRGLDRNGDGIGCE